MERVDFLIINYDSFFYVNIILSGYYILPSGILVQKDSLIVGELVISSLVARNRSMACELKFYNLLYALHDFSMHSQIL